MTERYEETKTDRYEEVSHPQHYQLPNGLEVLDLVEDLSFNLGNAIKYLFRVGRKPGADAETDMKKAVFYLEREIMRLERKRQPRRERSTAEGS
jgi:Protein of unknwon function (DUF3310)